jgi:hypothetical protein
MATAIDAHFNISLSLGPAALPPSVHHDPLDCYVVRSAGACAAAGTARDSTEIIVIAAHLPSSWASQKEAATDRAAARFAQIDRRSVSFSGTERPVWSKNWNGRKNL